MQALVILCCRHAKDTAFRAQAASLVYLGGGQVGINHCCELHIILLLHSDCMIPGTFQTSKIDTSSTDPSQLDELVRAP